MKLRLQLFPFFFLSIALLSSCSIRNQTMREPNSTVQFEKDDFTFSEQVDGEATSTKVFMVDWKRLFSRNTAYVPGDPTGMLDPTQIPVVGNSAGSSTARYALYNLMQSNPGYDVVFYPQFTTEVRRPPLLGFLYKRTKVKVQARLASIDAE